MTNAYVHLAASLAATALATGVMWRTIRTAMTASIIDAGRWRMVDRLRNHHGNVDVWCDHHEDGRGRVDCGAGVTKITYTAASVDVALAQAINDMEHAS